MFSGDGWVFIPTDSYGFVERKWLLPGRHEGGKTGFITLGADTGFLLEIILAVSTAIRRSCTDGSALPRLRI